MKPFCAEGGEITDEMCEKITLEWFKEQILFEKKTVLKLGLSGDHCSQRY